MFQALHQRLSLRRLLVTLAIAAVAGGLAFGVRSAAAADPAQAAPADPSPLHPTFALLDADGNNVLDSGQAVSTMQTCGSCHDTTFIEQHSFHADLGLSDFGVEGLDLAQPWDESRGVFGKWDPLTYRYLSPAGAQHQDLTTAEWLLTRGSRAPGGGPATKARDGTALLDLAPDAANPETAILEGGDLAAWDWQKSGVMEMNCFLCHLGNPDTQARADSIADGQFGWANTATLLATGVVTQTEKGSENHYAWQPAAFAADGELKAGVLQIQDPTNENCATCHGVVHTNAKDPLTLAACDLEQPQTATTGQVIAGQRIADSGLNLQNKDSLSRAWDVHAERDLKCTDCHYALNNPIHAQDAASARPSHLVYDPRRLEIGEYLERPDHNFARGESAQYTVDPDQKGSMRRCESCHEAADSHSGWLPYTSRHLEVLACESCHVPKLYAPAVSSVDWTVLNAVGGAVTECRGIEGSSTITGLVTGFQPVLMQRTNVDGDTLLAPYNLISSWYWVYDDPNGGSYPVRMIDLQSIYFQGGTLGEAYAPEIVAGFDADGDAQLSESELRIDSDAKRDLVAGRLAALGLANPRIEGQVQPYSINHNVARGEWATRDCQSCHHADSLITQPMEISGVLPGGVIPNFVSDANVAASGTIVGGDDGALLYQPQPQADGIYVFGRNRVNWVDWVGALAFVGVLLAVGIHGGLRFLAAMRKPRHRHSETKRVYMYQAYERFWHWLQTITIILLLFTGLIIHRPDMFGIFSFAGVVVVHNVLAAILVINAGLSLFWHVAGGEIRQYIPRPYGFFDQAILQTKYYLKGIFRDDEHPFEKTRDRHLNPLQQITYFGILNVLLPLQIITGALMWGVQQWPQSAAALGGLPFLAPFHSLVAWLFASFIVAHVYLTTTGHAPLSGIEAMVTGWEEVDVHAAEPGHAAPAEDRPDVRTDVQPGLRPSL